MRLVRLEHVCVRGVCVWEIERERDLKREISEHT
jgi:hypothetical protein